MKNGWTGGQYSLQRAGVALLLAALAVRIATDATDESSTVRTCAAVAVLASLALAIGWQSRAASVLLLGLAATRWIRVEGRELLAVLDAPFVPLLVWIALQVGVSSAPFGSCPARGRADPCGGWSLPGTLTRVAWIAGGVLLLARGRSEAHPTVDPLVRGPEPIHAWIATLLGAALLLSAWRARARRWAWIALILALVALAGLELEGVAALLWMPLAVFLFDPAWIPARGGAAVERLYYDGECGLCQRAVRFVLAEDPDGRRFRFAPLQGETFARALERDVRAKLPDSIVVQTADGRLLVRSAAAVHVLQRLGGFWRVLGSLLWLVPPPLRDFGYDAVAGVRKRLFAPPASLCPLGPAHVMQRFDP